MPSEAQKTAHGPAWTSDFFLCGVTPEGNVGDGDLGALAPVGTSVTCPDCRRLIDHVRAAFGARGYTVKDPSNE